MQTHTAGTTRLGFQLKTRDLRASSCTRQAPQVWAFNSDQGLALLCVPWYMLLPFCCCFCCRQLLLPPHSLQLLGQVRRIALHKNHSATKLHFSFICGTPHTTLTMFVQVGRTGLCPPQHKCIDGIPARLAPVGYDGIVDMAVMINPSSSGSSLI